MIASSIVSFVHRNWMFSAARWRSWCTRIDCCAVVTALSM